MCIQSIADCTVVPGLTCVRALMSNMLVRAIIITHRAASAAAASTAGPRAHARARAIHCSAGDDAAPARNRAGARARWENLCAVAQASSIGIERAASSWWLSCSDDDDGGFAAAKLMRTVCRFVKICARPRLRECAKKCVENAVPVAGWAR